MAIYAASCWGMPALVACIVAGIVLLLAHWPYLLLIPAAAAYATILDLENFRRAIIFTPTALRYRPTFGPLREIPLGRIFLLRRTEVAKGYRTPLNVPAVELTLVFGERLTLALDLDKGEEVIERLRKATNLQPL